MEILNQLGGLLLGSVPTAVFFILLVIAYTTLVRKPLEQTLNERRLRTSGAVEQARGAIAAAEAETAVFEDKLRTARAELLAWREQQKVARQHDRDLALEQTRHTAGDHVRAARTEIELAATVARQQIEQNSAQLGEKILQAILPGSVASAPSAEVRS